MRNKMYQDSIGEWERRGEERRGKEARITEESNRDGDVLPGLQIPALKI
jgi:hypothetical protein